MRLTTCLMVMTLWIGDCHMPTNHLERYDPAGKVGLVLGPWGTQAASFPAKDTCRFIATVPPGPGGSFGSMFFPNQVGAGGEFTFPIPLVAGRKYAFEGRYRWVNSTAVNDPRDTQLAFRVNHRFHPDPATTDEHVQDIRVNEDYEVWFEFSVPFTAIGFEAFDHYDQVEITRLDDVADLFMFVEFEYLRVVKLPTRAQPVALAFRDRT